MLCFVIENFRFIYLDLLADRYRFGNFSCEVIRIGLSDRE